MSVFGKGHVNSNSSWGHEVEINSWHEWDQTQIATPEAIDKDEYEQLQAGHERFYIVAVKWGRWECDGPASSQACASVLWVTADGRHGIQRDYPATRAGHDWHIDDGEEVPDSISEDLERAGDVPEERAVAFREIVRDAHGVIMSQSESNTQTDLTEFQTAAEIQTDEKPNWKPQRDDETDTGASTTCVCGNRVSSDFARVFGDNDDRVHECPDCSTYREIGGGLL